MIFALPTWRSLTRSARFLSSILQLPTHICPAEFTTMVISLFQFAISAELEGCDMAAGFVASHPAANATSTRDRDKSRFISFSRKDVQRCPRDTHSQENTARRPWVPQILLMDLP